MLQKVVAHLLFFFNEVNSINQTNFFKLFAIIMATGLRKLKDFYVPIKFCKHHALKSSRTVVVNLFNEVNSMNQSNLFNLFAILRRLVCEN